MKILLAGGGTAGHINPAIAIANTVKEHEENADIAFIYSSHGMEKTLVSKAGYPLHHIEMRGLQRNLSPSNIATLYYVMTAPGKAKKLIESFKPDIVVGTGGYLCWPLLHAAAKMGIPTAVHESNAIPGKAIRMLAKEVDRIYVNFADTANAFSDKTKVRHVGIPLITPPKADTDGDIREKLGVPKEAKHVILSFGGSLGAARVNAEILSVMENYTAKHPEIYHVHATGKSGYEGFMERAKEKGLLSCKNICISDYIYNMPLWEMAADVVICRSGAMTISEMALLGRTCILIPSPNVANNHQYENAKRLADAGAAVMLEEKSLMENTLQNAVANLLTNPEKRSEMAGKITAFANPHAKEDIYEDLQVLMSGDVLKLCRKSKK